MTALTPPWSGRTLSTAELIEWIRLNASGIKHLTIVATYEDDTIDVRTSTTHRECDSQFRELSAHAAALSHASFLSVSIRDRVIQP